jgi:hypothetical protein
MCIEATHDEDHQLQRRRQRFRGECRAQHGLKPWEQLNLPMPHLSRRESTSCDNLKYTQLQEQLQDFTGLICEFYKVDITLFQY